VDWRLVLEPSISMPLRIQNRAFDTISDRDDLPGYVDEIEAVNHVLCVIWTSSPEWRKFPFLAALAGNLFMLLDGLDVEVHTFNG
jgi:hypothetical protein